MLTGKCKEDFNRWFKFYIHSEMTFGLEYFNKCSFDNLPFSMRYGVYVDWFDSVNMEVFIDYSRANMFRFDIFHHFISLGDGNLFKTRPEARTKAIKKANEIYNSK